MAYRDLVAATGAIYQLGPAMEETGSARPFMHGRSPAVHLPKAFRLPEDRVRVRRVGNGVLLEPVAKDVDELFALLDRYRGMPFIEDRRQQPPLPPDEDVFEWVTATLRSTRIPWLACFGIDHSRSGSVFEPRWTVKTCSRSRPSSCWS